MHSGQVRDEGLRRVSSITRWVAATAVAGTAVLAAIVYKATPGRASSTPSTGGGATVTGPGANGPNVNDPNAGGGFQVPNQVPVPVQQPPLVRSGAS
jgi:hypothetical protein